MVGDNMKNIILFLALMILGTGVGCAALSEYITPASIDQKAVEYAVNAGVVTAEEFKGFANLEKAIRLETAVDNAYEIKTLALDQMKQKNQLDYGILKDVVTCNSQIAREREEKLFGETGLLSTGLTALGFGAFTGVLGLMRKRPGDVTQQEMEKVVADVKGEVTTKDRQMIEIIKGVQKFINIGSNGADILKECLTAEQSADTRQTVAIVKATLV